jgi:Domain of unknown function (DUF5916)/Carbohydrate family 9 binding domain-like
VTATGVAALCALCTLCAPCAVSAGAVREVPRGPRKVDEQEQERERDGVVVHSEDGRLEVRAVETRAPVVIDGVLDDAVWRQATSVGGFVQSEPQEGEPSTEQTEVQVAFDARYLYIAANCHDRDPSGIVVNDIREDFLAGDQDSFEVVLDTLADRRNGFVFMTNPEGARADQQMANEGREVNASWDAVWFVKTSRSAEGWVVEMAIPFTSLRFDLDKAPAWGVNFSRRIRRRNEVDFWSPVPRAYTLTRVSLAGNLVGLGATHPGRDFRIKPYVAASTVRDTGAESFHKSGDVGVDVKYGITRALTLDVTVKPDFAQVEADEQQVNLTQFSQFFPEKREFFLENSGVFYVGDAARNNRVTYLAPQPDTDLLLFFSRRIGLTDDGLPIPILAGGRLTGNLGGLAIGALTVQTERTSQEPENNFSVLRLRRNVFANSDVGAIFMSRQSADRSSDFNRVYGVDSNIRLFGDVDWSTYLVKTDTPGFGDGQNAFRTTVNREGNFFHIKTGYMSVGDGFNDELGYYRRTGVRKYMIDTGVRPRPRSFQSKGVRELHPHIVWNLFTDHQGEMVAKDLHTGFTFFFNNGGHSQIAMNPTYELLTSPLQLAPDSPPLPPGGYSWTTYVVDFSTDPSLVLSGAGGITLGGLWSGTQQTFSGTVTYRPSYKFRVSLKVDRTSASLGPPVGDFVTTLSTLRANYSFATNTFLDSLVQYDAARHLFNANIRFNIMYRPLSDLFVVYNEQRFATPDDPVPAGRSIIVKFTRMFSF